MDRIKKVGKSIVKFAREKKFVFGSILAVAVLLVASLSFIVSTHFDHPQVTNLAEGVMAVINQPEKEKPMQTYELLIKKDVYEISLDHFVVIPFTEEPPASCAVEIGPENGELFIQEMRIEKLDAKKFNALDYSCKIANIEVKNVNAEGIHHSEVLTDVNINFPVTKETKVAEDSQRSIDKVIIKPLEEKAQITYLKLTNWKVDGTISLKNLTIGKLVLNNLNIGANDGLTIPDVNLEIVVQNHEGVQNQLEKVFVGEVNN